jgi:hypothetical protein
MESVLIASAASLRDTPWRNATTIQRNIEIYKAPVAL